MLRVSVCFLVLHSWADAKVVSTAVGCCESGGKRDDDGDELALLRVQAVDGPSGAHYSEAGAGTEKAGLESLWTPFNREAAQPNPKPFPPADTDDGRRALVYSGRIFFRGPYSQRRPDDHDVALYLDKNSPLWGKGPISTDDVVKHVQGFEILFQSPGLPRWFPHMIMRPLARDIALSIVSVMDGFTETDLDKLLEITFMDPQATRFDSIVGIRLDGLGSLMHSNGQQLGRWDNTDFIKKASRMVVGDDSILQGLREELFINLARGGPSSGVSSL